MEKEQERSTSSCFITLTYEEPPLSPNGWMTLRSQDVTKFIKRLRHESKEKLKYYSVGEYGSKYNRPHYHIIMFNLPQRLVIRSESIAAIWHGGSWEPGVKPGIIQVDACTSGSIGYVAGYCQQGTWVPDHCQLTGLIDDRRPHYSTMSKGLGDNYLTPQQIAWHKKTGTIVLNRPGGHIQRLPRFYRDKIFSRAERERIYEESQEIENYDFEKWFRSAEHRIEYTRVEQQKFEQKVNQERNLVWL